MSKDYEKLRQERLAKLDPARRAPYDRPRKPLRELGVEGMRERGRALDPPYTPDPDVPYRDIEIAGPAGPIPTRIFTPKGGAAKKGIYLSVHAGGYIMWGGLGAQSASNSALAKDTDCIVIAPDFRLPPDHRFPAAVDDCWAVLKWINDNAASLGGSAQHIGVGGGCTGGNIAAAIALMARDAGAPKLAAQYFASTVFDCRTEYLSFIENGEGYTLSADDDRYVIEVYLQDMENRFDWRASPVLATTMKGLPPSYIWVGEWDVLRDENVAYGNRLKEAGIDVTLVVAPEESHGAGPGSADTVRKDRAAFLRKHLTPA